MQQQLVPSWTTIEEKFLQVSNRKATYPGEHIATVEVENIYELGKLVAVTFLDWVHSNPRGVVALPTGRTPEYFIKYLEKYTKEWHSHEVQKELKEAGYLHSSLPETSNLVFVMLDEFFPVFPTHRNAFCNYIHEFYVTSLMIKQENVLSFDLIGENVLTKEELDLFISIDVDLSLLVRPAMGENENVLKEVLLKVQAYCDSYELRIEQLGGIGFFLGGIGPDGHIAFNQACSSLQSRTRLVSFNYPTAAAAAGDLGGIEIARGKAAMTIGLRTITFNEHAKIIIMAAGEGKAAVVRAAIEDEPSEERPASVLHAHRGARFYLTHGAASLLTARKAELVTNISEEVISWALAHLSGHCSGLRPHLVQPPEEYSRAETLLYDLSLRMKVPVHSLLLEHLTAAPELLACLPPWFQTATNFSVLSACASRRLREKIEGGLSDSVPVGMNILHTAPHHDDIMLSYHGAMHSMLGILDDDLTTGNSSVDATSNSNHNITSRDGGTTHPNAKRRRAGSYSLSSSQSQLLSAASADRLGERRYENTNYFAYLTSGFHSVNDNFLRQQVQAVRGQSTGVDVDGNVTYEYSFLEAAVTGGEIARDYDDLMDEFRDAFFTRDLDLQDKVEHKIFLRKVAEMAQLSPTLPYGELINSLKQEIARICSSYLDSHTAGDSVPKEMQLLKGCMRESEVDRVWALSNMPMNRISHMRSKFYNDDFFTPMPSLEDDALPMANLIRDRQPQLLTVAFDPEGTGPDTHYKVLQVVAAGLRIALDRGDLCPETAAKLVIWGYRNVWFVFTPADATLFVPCSDAALELMHQTFMSCFTTQKKASFPSPHYDGPFSAWAKHIQREQRVTLGVLLGEEYFASHPDARVRNSKGFIFLKAMEVARFLREVEELKSKFEVTK